MSKMIEVVSRGAINERVEYFVFEELAKIFCISSNDDSVPEPLRFKSIIPAGTDLYLVLEFLNGERRYFLPGISCINFV